jgi:hypothetical protein
MDVTHVAGSGDSAEIARGPTSWRTVAVYRLERAPLAAWWLLPLDEAAPPRGDEVCAPGRVR